MGRACWLAALIVGCALARRGVAQEVCTPDPQLTQAAAELLLAGTQRPSPQLLTEAVRASGSDGVGLHALFVPAGAPTDAERQWLATLRTRVDGELYCGRADNEAGRLLIGLGRGAELAPIDPHARIVRGRMHAGFRDAELVIAAGSAQLVRVGVGDEDLRKGVELSAELPLPLKVQLVAHGPGGPRPVAERELHDRARESTASEPENVRRDVPRPAAAPSSAQEFAEQVLALRAARGRRSLRPNRLLREAASQHAQDVCAKGRVAHEVEPGAGPDARLARAGLDARLLGEAIARAQDMDSALNALQNSPSHLYTLLDPRFTDFGIGVAKDQAQKYCYVVLLCAWPRYIGKR